MRILIILNFKDVDEEFEFKYLDKMTDVSIEFRDFIYKNYLPFMDKNVFVNYTLYDLLKITVLIREYYQNGRKL